VTGRATSNRVREIDRTLEIELPKARGDGWSISCKGMVKSAVGPADDGGKWECPVCGKRVSATKSGYLVMHRARAAR
jgi:hypothetical protein